MALIYDRTQQDVANAIKIRSEKVQKFQELTEDDIAILERGTITVNTLNRIEDKQVELRSLINDMGYWNTPIRNKNWSTSEIFDEDNFQRILDNLNILKRAFFVYKNTPNTPNVSYNFNDINAIEKILFDIELMIEEIKDLYRECGDIECGLQ